MSGVPLADETAPTATGNPDLDALFECFLDAAEAGVEPDWRDIDPRVELHEAERLWTLARESSPIRAERRPVIPGYPVIAELGRGGMGTVYLVRDESLGGRPVALKVFPAWAHLSRSLRARFESESTSLARLRHPNIITVYGVVSAEHLTGFTMEWINGGTLGRLIGRWGARDLRPSGEAAATGAETGGWHEDERWRYLCRVARTTADALAAVHGAGLLHRDVKPSNILLRPTGEPVLSDFGLVRDAGSTAHTQTGQFLGTSSYAPPEQLRGEDVDARCDVFSLGVTLYHALAGGLPWADAPASRKAALVDSVSPTALHRLAPEIPRELSAVVHKAIEADPAGRYAGAGELAEELGNCLEGRPVRARPDNAVRRVGRHIKRHRGQALAAAWGVAAAFVLSFAAIAWWVVIPSWSDRELRSAREHMMNLDPNLALVTRIYFNFRSKPGWQIARDVDAGDTVGRIPRPWRAALAHYRTSALLAQGRRGRVVEHRATRAAVELVSGVESGETLAGRWREMPAIAAYFEKIGAGRFNRAYYRDPAPPSPGSTAEARALGLIAFHVGDYGTALEAWGRFDREADADPVVEALLGELYLMMGEPALAYPRLRAAFDAFPGTRSLNAGLAEAAARVGDFARAERLIERALELPDADRFGRLTRVKGLILESRGELDDALGLYESLAGVADYRGNPVFVDQHADLLWRMGHRERAVTEWAVGHASFAVIDLLMRRFLEHFPVWWTGLNGTERAERLRSAPFGVRHEIARWGSVQFEPSLVDLLRCEGEFRAELGTRPARLDETWRGGEPRDWTLPTACSPLAERLRVSDDVFWSRLATAPDGVKRVLGEAWASGDHAAIAAAESAVEDLPVTP